MIYTLEELLVQFPMHERIDKDKIKEMIYSMYDNCQNYQDIYQYFEDYINTCFPGADYEKYGFDSPERKEYYHYLDNYEDENILSLYEWSKYAGFNYINHKGKRRTFEEACQIAADKWCEMLFNFHLQDNGAINEDHGGGFYACALATVLKNEANKDITEEMINNTNKNLYEYYHNYCIYEDKYPISPYCDYDPNRPLYDILQKSGIPEKKIRSICPWKTGIDIDENDNAVVIKGYQKREYI
jgi:hypothetical protein